MSARTFFDVLGVRKAFHLQGEELEQKYLALSKQFHPDRFARALPRERLEAVKRTTDLNDAYRVLKNDVKRAEYLLKLEGLDIAEERPSSTSGADERVKIAPALLMDVMELNEALAEARADGNAQAVAALAEQVRGERAATWARVDQGFAAVEAGDRAALDEIAQALILMRYQARFLEQVEAFESAADSKGAE